MCSEDYNEMLFKKNHSLVKFIHTENGMLIARKKLEGEWGVLAY